MRTVFGTLVRERRNERGMTVTDLAERLGVSKSYASMLENGARPPSAEQVKALAAILDIPADVLTTAAGRLPPDVEVAVPKYAEQIVSTIRCLDEEARVSFPTQLTDEFRATLLAAAEGAGPEDGVPPYGSPIRSGKNSQTYRAHSYHTKVPPEAIEKLVRHHTTEGQLVMDPFCGSGMTGVAAMRNGRHAVLSDLSPAAVHIARNYTTPCDPSAFMAAVGRVAQRMRQTVAWLYETGTPAAPGRVEYTVWSDIFECPRCGAPVVYWDAARDPDTGAVTEGVRCSVCRHINDKRALRWVGERPVETSIKYSSGRVAHPPTGAELELIERARAAEVLGWHPRVPFDSDREMWRAGHSASGIFSVADFYTKRNLHALAALRFAIFEERDDRLRAALLFAFTGIVNRASRRYQWNPKRPTNVMTGTLYVSSLRYEWNVWSLFERKAGDVGRYFEHLGTPPGRVEVVLGSATSLAHLPDRCIDYVFMDPPFGSNIFYADSSILWDAWLGSLTDQRREIVVNKHRSPSNGGKTLDDYQRLMAEAFREVARVLKPTAYATLQFNNSSDEVWCAIQEALRDAGLEVRHVVGLDKIHPSIKGVKGRQHKEQVASLDSLIELRRTVHAAARTPTRPATEEEVDAAIRRYAASQSRPFSTDEVFSHLVRTTFANGASLSGISLQSIGIRCARVLDPAGQLWRPLTVTDGAETRAFEPVTGPGGCLVSRFLTRDEDIRQVIDPARPAPDVRGTAPRVVAGQRNTALYNAHSYHTKVPPEAIIPILKHFSRPGDVVLDPFCGSGMTGVAALLSGRRAILSDLSVAAVHLAYNHTRPCSAAALSASFDRIYRALSPRFRDLYACADGKERGYVHYTLWSRDATCPKCGGVFSVWDSIDRVTGRMPSALTCPHCGQRSPKHSLRYAGNRPVLLSYERPNGERREKEPNAEDLALLEGSNQAPIAAWYPEVAVDSSREMYIRSALQLQGIRTLADFYTRRNLNALALLWERINAEEDDRLRAALAFAFTNTAWHGTRMRRYNARGGQRPLTGTLYIPQLSSEANVLEVMRHKIRQLRTYYEALGRHEQPLPVIRLGSATKLHGVPDASIDYVFTDPPFGSNIFYADCNLIWESWLGGLTSVENEAVVNRSLSSARGGKTVEDYQRLLTEAMREIHRVLKAGAWATLVFHNTDPAVWRAIQNAAADANLEVEDAGALDRKQQSHKGYKGRAEQEDVAHFDVVMSMRKPESQRPLRQRPVPAGDIGSLIREAAQVLQAPERTVQRVHSEVIQRLVREGRDFGAVTFEDVREHMPRDEEGNKREAQLPLFEA